MTISAHEQIFVLSDEIIDHIRSFFLRSDSHQAMQACMGLQALINVIGMMLCELDSEFTTKAVAKSFARMLKDIRAIKAEIDSERKVQYIH